MSSLRESAYSMVIEHQIDEVKTKYCLQRDILNGPIENFDTAEQVEKLKNFLNLFNLLFYHQAELDRKIEKGKEPPLY